MHSLPFIPVRIPGTGRYSVRITSREESRMQLHALWRDKRTLLNFSLLTARLLLGFQSRQTGLALSQSVRFARQAQPSARGCLRISATPHRVRGFGFGWLGRSLPYTTLCATRQLLSAAAIRHRRLLHGITVKRAPLRAFPP